MSKLIYAACLVTLPVAAIAAPAANPWFGTWKLRLADPKEKPETLVYSDGGSGAMRMMSVEDGVVLVTRFDGKPSSDIAKPGKGPPILAVKALSPTRYDWTFFRDGKPFVRGTNTLAADRKSFTEVSWLIANPEKRVTLIYDRQ